MPRYCAAIYCKNRRGRNHKDRKLSFYPFPLHDKDRLEKWLKNMKRDSWVPSKYQFLCSDHFTPDSLDIRWGIRYLKQTAIPTIFSLPEDSEGKDPLKKKPQKKKSEEKEVCLQASQEGSFASKVTSKNLDKDVPPKHAESLHSFALVTPPAPKAGSIQNSIVTLNLVRQDTAKPDSTSETAVNQDTDLGSFHTPFENLSSTTVTLTTSDSEDAQQSLETPGLLEKNPNHHANPTLANSMEIKSQENPSLLSPINQTVEELNTDKESVSASFVPTEDSKPAINCFTPAGKEITEMEDTDMEDSFCRNLDYGTEVLQLEHSYCRQDVNKENLWQKVSKLHSKVTLLELQEQQTLGRLKSLEALIRQLTQESWLSEENVKVIENHFTTYEVTMT